MNPNAELSFVTLILEASWVVKTVMLILLYFTLQSWYLIGRKWLLFRYVRFRTQKFEKRYASGEDVGQIYNAIAAQKMNSPIEHIFIVGVEELKKVARSQRDAKSSLIDNIRRAMFATYQKQMDEMESGLNSLATIGSVSPYIGLFGTVWGIMHAFRGLANVGQATLSQVAPGIAEALVATAIGLFAAIPAVLAYNRFNYEVMRMNVRFEAFVDEFQNTVALHLN